MTNVIDDAELYDTIELGDVESPGVVTLSGHDLKVEWDIKGGSAQKGATTTLKQIPPVEFTATFYLVKDDAQGIDDFEFWPDFEDLIKSTVNGKKPKALDIWHPDLEARGIKSVTLANLGGMTYDGKGGARVAVKFQVYSAPKPAGGTPNGSLKSKSAADDPNAAAKAELAALVEQYKKTPVG